jgi:hypothetical protein
VVETGRRFDDQVEIVKGLEPGEKIVLSGNFLVSSESRLKGATELYEPLAGQAPLPEQDKNTAANPRQQHELKNTGSETSRPAPATSLAPHHGRHHG